VNKPLLLAEIPNLIAAELKVHPHQVRATADLLAAGNTVPFIARYRKEATGELTEEQIRAIEDRLRYCHNLIKRQEEVLASIAAQGKLTPELETAIIAATKLHELEDIYLPFRPKKRTRAQLAREKGLEPLAMLILAQQLSEGSPLTIAQDFATPANGLTAAAALEGAQDIIAEIVSGRPDIRGLIRRRLWQAAELATELAVSEAEGQEFLTYKEYREPVRCMPPHRILAVNRGERRKMIKVRLLAIHAANVELIERNVIKQPSIFTDIIRNAIADGYKRLLLPSLERELRSELTETAERQAIKVFSHNLRQLLLQPPLAGHTVMGLDPGYRTGCKLAVVDPTGKVLTSGTLFITHGQAQYQQAQYLACQIINQFGVSLIAIGNGTASFETEEFVSKLIADFNLNVHYLIANEAGASVYSASPLAKEELPGLDVTLRGAVSIARRIQDPLAELVKIDPKSLGVGQYQHDVDQKELAKSLSAVVESCVNHVGVDLNTASPTLLTFVAGINATIAKNIVAYRNQHGKFKNREELLRIPRLGKTVFTQCAGFLRIKQGTNPLDNTSVHPESYPLAEKILAQLGFSLESLQDKHQLERLQARIQECAPEKLAAALSAGVPTVRDILAALAKPGRDPREDLPPPIPRKQLIKLSDLVPGTIVKGTVHNITDFGVFVDIGIKQSGLIHRSELSDKPFRHPLDVVAVGDIVDCLILSVDESRVRIALSLKQANDPKTKKPPAG